MTKRSLIFLLFNLVVVGSLQAQGSRAGKVSWARLKTEYRFWNRHSSAEPVILKFIHDHTNLDIEDTWKAADINHLEQLVTYPFLYSEGIHTVKDPLHLRNLQEYLKRGGFLVIDSCINPEVTENPDVFVRDQIRLLNRLLPGAKTKRLPKDHSVYSIFFTIEGGAPHSFNDSVYDPEWAKHGLYAVFYEDSPVAVVSVSGMKCGWAGFMTWPGHDVLSCQMILNIYIWAMTQ